MVPVRSGPVACTALIVSVALSACAAGSEPTRVEDGPGTVPVAAVGGPGVEGVVHDESFSPLPFARVFDPVANVEAVSDALGAFLLGPLTPGTHTIFVQLPGYHERSASVIVPEQGFAQMNLVLTALPTDEPYSVTRLQRGIVGCSASVYSNVPQFRQGINGCGTVSGVVNLSQYDTTRLVWRLSGNLLDLKAGVFELQWQTTQASGASLWQLWEVLQCPDDPNTRFVSSAGKSPLRIRLNITHLDRHFEIINDSPCSDAKENCNYSQCALQTRVFAWPDFFGPDYPWNAGATFQQTYTAVLSEFYVDAGPLSFSAVDPGG